MSGESVWFLTDSEKGLKLSCVEFSVSGESVW